MILFYIYIFFESISSVIPCDFSSLMYSRYILARATSSSCLIFFGGACPALPEEVPAFAAEVPDVAAEDPVLAVFDFER